MKCSSSYGVQDCLSCLKFTKSSGPIDIEYYRSIVEPLYNKDGVSLNEGKILNEILKTKRTKGTKKLPFTYHGQKTMAEVHVTSFHDLGFTSNLMFDNKLNTHWGSRENHKGFLDKNPIVTVTFYSIKEVNRVKLVRIQDGRYRHRYADLCVTLLDDTNNLLDEKCTGPTGVYGGKYLVHETNSIDFSFNSVQNVKTVKLNFKGKEFAHIAELYIDGLH